jgi:hypothetical protein
MHVQYRHEQTQKRDQPKISVANVRPLVRQRGFETNVGRDTEKMLGQDDRWPQHAHGNRLRQGAADQ